MSESDYRLFAVELVRKIKDLLAHPGSKQALAFAEEWANDQACEAGALDAVREAAERGVVEWSADTHDARDYAARAALDLLATQVAFKIRDIIHNVSAASVMWSLARQHGEFTNSLQPRFDALYAAEKEILESWLAKLEASG